MKYPAGYNTFVPEATGIVIEPLKMSEAEADAIFGKPLMDALRERASRPFKVNKYVQLVKVEPEEPRPPSVLGTPSKLREGS